MASLPGEAVPPERDEDQLSILLETLRVTAADGCQHAAAYTTESLGEHITTLDAAYRVCLGRRPDAEAKRQFERRGPMWGVISALLESFEFRGTILARLLHRYEDVQRGFYIHVPKTAGTSVTASLEGREDWHVWTTASQDPVLTPLDELLVEVHAAASRLEEGLDRFWCVGHTALSRWDDLQLLNDDSIVFTTTRHPFDLYVSMANYAVGHIQREPLHRLSLRWASWLHAADPVVEPTEKSLAAAMLTSEGFAVENANVFVRYLGGPSATAAAAFRRVHRLGCKLVPLEDLSTFLDDIGASGKDLRRLNASGKGALRVADLNVAQLDHLTDRLAGEDLKYWSLEDYFSSTP